METYKKSGVNMLNDNEIGKVYYNYQLKQCQIVGTRKVNENDFYMVNTNYPEEARGGWDLWKEEDLGTLKDKQEKFLELIETNKQKEIEEQKQKEHKAIEKIEQEKLFGFMDGKTQIQQAKILNCLIKQFSYNGKVKTRKQFVIDLVKTGYIAKIKTFSNIYNKRAKNPTTTEYCLYHPIDNTFFTVTKTEYDFFNYLNENHINIMSTSN